MSKFSHGEKFGFGVVLGLTVISLSLCQLADYYRQYSAYSLAQILLNRGCKQTQVVNVVFGIQGEQIGNDSAFIGMRNKTSPTFECPDGRKEIVNDSFGLDLGNVNFNDPNSILNDWRFCFPSVQ